VLSSRYRYNRIIAVEIQTQRRSFWSHQTATFNWIYSITYVQVASSLRWVRTLKLFNATLFLWGFNLAVWLTYTHVSFRTQPDGFWDGFSHGDIRLQALVSGAVCSVSACVRKGLQGWPKRHPICFTLMLITLNMREKWHFDIFMNKSM